MWTVACLDGAASTKRHLEIETDRMEMPGFLRQLSVELLIVPGSAVKPGDSVATWLCPPVR